MRRGIIQSNVVLMLIIKDIIKGVRVNFKVLIIAYSLLFFMFNNGRLVFSLDENNLGVNLEKEIIYGDVGRKLDMYLLRLVPFGFSGAILVSIDDKVILNKGYGMANKENKILNKPLTVYSIGSLTKQFTAAAILKLEMMGKLSIDDLISKYFIDIPEDKKGIKIHHLLTHTSGIISGSGGGYAIDKEEEISKILFQQLLFQPGSDFQYSNEGYTLLAAIIEKVSGMEYKEFLNEYIFKPAGMTRTGYNNNLWERWQLAVNYSKGVSNGIFVERPENKYPNWKLVGNGGICSTIGDMYKWFIALNSNKVLSSEAKSKMFTPFLNDYGYGWEIIKREDVGVVIQHDGGSTLGNAAEMRIYKDKNVVTIAFSNQDGTDILLNKLRDKIESIVFGKEVALPPVVGSFDSLKGRKYSGKYILQNESNSGFIIETDKEYLRLKPFGQGAYNILYDFSLEELKLIKLLNKLSELILRGSLSGDFIDLSKIIKEEEKYMRFRNIFEKLIRNHNLINGEVKIEGTIQYSRSKEVRATICKLEKNGNFITVALIWKDSNLIGLEVLDLDNNIELYFLPVTNIKYVSYDIKLERPFTIFFAEDLQGKVIGFQMNKRAFKKVE